MRRQLLTVLVFAAALGIGCAHPRHTAVVVDAALFEVLNDTHALEQAVLCGQPSCAGVMARVTPNWTDAKSQTFNTTLLPAVAAGREFNALLAQWDPAKPMPMAISTLITSLSNALTAVTLDFPPGTTRERMLAAIARAQSIALTAIQLVLSVQGN